ncbi:MAG: hypothetical protein LBR80_10890 [Deltaproteobacteria bacterium]|jgi:hypothetical protein|nr:hypothetical protein [Deltaproteobacteria bacterium]
MRQRREDRAKKERCGKGGKTGPRRKDAAKEGRQGQGGKMRQRDRLSRSEKMLTRRVRKPQNKMRKNEIYWIFIRKYKKRQEKFIESSSRYSHGLSSTEI